MGLRLHTLVEASSDAITWALLRLVFVPEAGWRELRKWRDDGVTHGDVDTSAEPPEWREFDREAVTFLWNLEEDASEHTDDKLKLLLTLSASLGTGVVVVTRGTDSAVPWAIGAAALVVTAYLCLAALTVRTYWTPTATKDVGNWIRDIYSCYLGNQEAHQLRVGLLRGARRWFLVAMVSVGLSGVTTRHHADRVADALEALNRSVAHLAVSPLATDSPRGLDSLVVELRRLTERLRERRAQASVVHGAGRNPRP